MSERGEEAAALIQKIAEVAGNGAALEQSDAR